MTASTPATSPPPARDSAPPNGSAPQRQAANSRSPRPSHSHSNSNSNATPLKHMSAKTRDPRNEALIHHRLGERRPSRSAGAYVGEADPERRPAAGGNLA